MNDSPDMLDFVKAASDADRLRIIGILVQHPSTIRAVSQELNIPFRLAFNHLAYLEFAGMVRKKGDVFVLDESTLETISKKQFSGGRRAFIPASDLDLKTRKVLAAHLNADGTIGQIPIQPGKLRIILTYLIPAFKPGINYSEKEVNSIPRHFHEDTAALRRYLVEAGLLARESDGSRYWRTPELVAWKPL